MVARTTQTQVKPSSVKRLNGAAPHAEEVVHAAPASSFEQAQARFAQAQDDFMAFLGTPGWKRTLVAAVSGLAVAAVGAYVVGAIVGYLMVGALLATSSMFLTMVLAVLASVWLGHKVFVAAARIGGAILTGEADERAIAAYDATRSFVARCNPLRLFAAKPVVAA